MLAGCTGNSSPVGLLDVQRLTANWPQFNNAQNQLASDEHAIETSSASAAAKRAQAQQVEAKFSKISDQLVSEIRAATSKVAEQRSLKLVVTREYVGYGGTDITPDVEKILGITEASPTASPKS